MIVDVYSNCVHPRFEFRVRMWAQVNFSNEILEILRISTSWNQVSWSFVVSNIIPGDSWYISKSSHMSSSIFKNIDFLWFLVDFWCSVRRVLRPLSSARGVPQVTISHKQRWCVALSSRGQVVRSTLLQGTSFRNQGGLGASGGESPVHQVSYCQIVSKWIILDSYCNYF